MRRPNARIYELDDDGINRTEYDELQAVRLMRGFLEAPERYLRQLFGKRRSAERPASFSTDDKPWPRTGPQPLAFRASASHVLPAALNAGLLVSSEVIWLAAAAGLAVAVVGSG